MLGYVIGDSDMVVGFRLVGVDGIEAGSSEEAQQALSKAFARHDLGIVIISEEFSSQPPLREMIDKIRHERRDLLVVEMPGSKGKASVVRMSDLISKTLGVRM